MSGAGPAPEAFSTGHRRVFLGSIILLIALRLAGAALLPLTADEAYYWLWSRHLAWGYFDHPPLIAFLVRGGTDILGSSPFGVRLLSVLASVAASGFVFAAAREMLGTTDDGLRAALYFNLTLMVAVEGLAATPDAPEIACAAAFLFALGRLQSSADGRWWLAAGLAGGLALLSKYTGFFLGVGALLWLVALPEGRVWLRSPWLYLGAVLSLLLFLPNLLWNASHHWVTFAFQFGRVGQGGFTLRYIAEFIGAELGLASPLLLALAGAGLGLAARDARLRIVAVLVAPSLLYFLVHATHDRVQANWPSFLFPAVAVLAAAASASGRHAGASRPMRALAGLAAPVAAAMVALCYAQAFFGIVPLGRADPLTRLLGFGMPDVASAADRVRVATGSQAFLATDYATAAWLAYYGPPGVPVVAVDSEPRWASFDAPAGPRPGLPFLYVAEGRKARLSLLEARFDRLSARGALVRKRGEVVIGTYETFVVSGPIGGPDVAVLP